ncbi:hypothetical protein GGI19_001258 [Coemansia pectinata]|uniref:Uncharacterized protein n=1 Tax=Coemansia pectinata TaxID=1052879 RepID=A0A9W8LCZ4_9FUNG|nr:hypothetical protein GGI19_001258 [Coemansia pectinata]
MVKRSKRRTSKQHAHVDSDEEVAPVDTSKQIEEKSPSTSLSPTRPRSARVQARQEANPERMQVIQRLKDAFNAGEFDTDLENSDSEEEAQKSKTHTQGTKAKQQKQAPRRRSLRGRQVHDDHDHEPVGDGLEAGAETEEQLSARKQLLKKSEQKLILKFKTKGLDASGLKHKASQLEDIDWSEFDPETLSAILARREELRKRRRRNAGEAVSDDEATTAKLKRSSLAPVPLHPDTARQGDLPTDEGEIAVEHSHALETAAMTTIEEEEEPLADDSENAFEDDSAYFVQVGADRSNIDGMDVDVEGNQTEYNYLFGEAAEVPQQTLGASLLLPPRPMASRHDASEIVAANGRTEIPPALLQAIRPQMAMLRGPSDGQAGGILDMRLVLQRELKREEDLLKDLRAEIVDKISKLATEEKLLRMVVKHDFELPGDDLDEDTHVPETPFGVFNEVDDVLAPTLSGVVDQNEDMHEDEVSAASSDSDDSLSGMSSSSSDDEVQDEDVTRGALSRMLTQYLPSAEAE